MSSSVSVDEAVTACIIVPFHTTMQIALNRHWLTAIVEKGTNHALRILTGTRAVPRRDSTLRATPFDDRRGAPLNGLGARLRCGLWRQLSEEPLLTGIHIPEFHGGSGSGFVELSVATEEMGRCLLYARYFSSAVLAANTILNSGADAMLAGNDGPLDGNIAERVLGLPK